jgi:hypothetical protein
MVHKLDKLISAVSVMNSIENHEEVLDAMDEAYNQTLH